MKGCLINQLKVYCVHQDKGCQWGGELGQLGRHLNEKPSTLGATSLNWNVMFATNLLSELISIHTSQMCAQIKKSSVSIITRAVGGKVNVGTYPSI